MAANYRAACRARSKPEFVAKLGVVEEEADESAFWLELIIETNLLSTDESGASAERGKRDRRNHGVIEETAAKSQIANRKSAIR